MLFISIYKIIICFIYYSIFITSTTKILFIILLLEIIISLNPNILFDDNLFNIFIFFLSKFKGEHFISF